VEYQMAQKFQEFGSGQNTNDHGQLRMHPRLKKRLPPAEC